MFFLPPFFRPAMLPSTLGPFLSLLALAGLQSIWSSTPQDPKAPGTPQSEISSLHHPTWTLGLHLYRSLHTDTSQTNTLICPLLLANSLLALHSGAKGSTADQFHNLLRNTKDKNAFSGALKSVRESNGTSFILHSSSALFSKQAPKLEKSFLDDL